MDHQKRLQKLQNWIKGEDLDAVLIQSPENRYYYSGFTGSFAYLLVSAETAWLLTDSRYWEQATAQAPNFQLVKLGAYTPIKSIAIVAEKADVEVLGFEGSGLTADEYLKLVRLFGRPNMVDVGSSLALFRSIKDAAEIERLARAEAIGDAAFAHILKMIRPGMRERDVALELEFEMRRFGASGTSFETIVASGARSALPHGVASDKVIEAGDMVVLDFGCRYEGYCSDMTRTIAVGEPSEEMRALYELVWSTQLACLEAIQAGVIGKDIHQIAVDRFTAAGFGDYFGHGLGHSVGLEIHETPRFSAAEKNTIEAGVCITVEPGLYLPGRGGVRIEDLIVVTENGHQNLTMSTKSLIIC